MGNVPSVTCSRQSIKIKNRKIKARKTNQICKRKDNFILSLSAGCIQVVNGDNKELMMISNMVRSQCTVLREGWAKNMIYFFKLGKTNKDRIIHLVGDILLSLYQGGWDPLSPVDLGTKKMGMKTAICFRRRSLSQGRQQPEQDSHCLCLETSHANYLVLHQVPSTVLVELVSTAHAYWGIDGVSMGVHSVIQDYVDRSYEVISTGPGDGQDKFIKLIGQPWTADPNDGTDTECLEVSMIACLAMEGYKLNMAMNMEASSRAFFFIKSAEESPEVWQLDKASAGIGSKQSLCLYRPIIKRSRTAFFRSFNGRESLKRRVRRSLKRKSGKDGFILNGKTRDAWFKETSIDIATDYEDDDDLEDQ